MKILTQRSEFWPTFCHCMTQLRWSIKMHTHMWHLSETGSPPITKLHHVKFKHMIQQCNLLTSSPVLHYDYSDFAIPSL